jgi:hypothetical protein
MHKQDFKKPDKQPINYNQKLFKIDGRVDLDITFDDKVIHTPVYVKMDAAEQLLLAEGLCRQLNINFVILRCCTWKQYLRDKTHTR